MDNYYIYALLSGENVGYVGMTKNIEKRYKQHLYCKSKNIALNEWIRNNKIHYKILQECSKDDWEEREKYWIAYYGLSNLFNIHEGGVIKLDGFKYRKKTKKINISTSIQIDKLINKSELAKELGLKPGSIRDGNKHGNIAGELINLNRVIEMWRSGLKFRCKKCGSYLVEKYGFGRHFKYCENCKKAK